MHKKVSLIKMAPKVSLNIDNTIAAHKPYIVAGPCSAETEEQVHETIQKINDLTPEVHLIRAGIWKPRTRPNSFEGVGEKALSWLKAAASAIGRPVTVEVAKAAHVEAALKHNVDVLWIGARSTVNPFIIQEIADALEGVDIPVMVKNPINPDIDLWIGAFERLNKSGISKLTAIHRGFSTYEQTEHRNRPSWEIPIELRRRVPNMPIICDPSHIAGKRDLIASVTQKAMDLGFDGLMIETHRNPDDAWSDAKQQLTPYQLKELLAGIELRATAVENDVEEYKLLLELRSKIDRIDNYIIELLAERMGIAEEIGFYKKDRNIAVFQAKRWRDTVKRALEMGKNNKLTEEFILKLFQQIHKESIHHQIQVVSVEEAKSADTKS